jgi:hypothetical protein
VNAFERSLQRAVRNPHRDAPAPAPAGKQAIFVGVPRECRLLPEEASLPRQWGKPLGLRCRGRATRRVRRALWSSLRDRAYDSSGRGCAGAPHLARRAAPTHGTRQVPIRAHRRRGLVSLPRTDRRRSRPHLDYQKRLVDRGFAPRDPGRWEGAPISPTAPALAQWPNRTIIPLTKRHRATLRCNRSLGGPL